MMAYDAEVSLELRPATLSLSRTKDPEHKGFGLFQKYISTIWAEGEIAQLSGNKVGFLDAEESENRILLRLLPDGALVRRKDNVERSDDAFLRIKENVYSQGGGYLRVPAEPLAPGVYAFLLENQNLPGLSGLDDGAPSTLFYGPPVGGPAFLFEIVGNSSGESTAARLGKFRPFTPLRDHHDALLGKVENARDEGKWEEAIRLLLESQTLASGTDEEKNPPNTQPTSDTPSLTATELFHQATIDFASKEDWEDLAAFVKSQTFTPGAKEEKNPANTQPLSNAPALTVTELFKQATIDFASKEDWEDLAAFVKTVGEIHEPEINKLQSDLRTVESAAKAEEYEADLRRKNSRLSELPPNANVADAWFSRGDLFLEADMPEKARECWERAVMIACPEGHAKVCEDRIGNLAWFLSTSPDARYRDGKRAFELATMTEDRTGDAGDQVVLRIKAAALAESGHYDLAAQTQLRALTSFQYQEKQSPKPDDEITPGLDFAAGDLARFALYQNQQAFRQNSDDFERIRRSLLETVPASLGAKARDLTGWWRFRGGIFNLGADGRYQQIASSEELVSGTWRLKNDRIIEVTISTINNRTVNRSVFERTIWIATDNHLVYHETDKEREKRIAGRAELAFPKGLPTGETLAGRWECTNLPTPNREGGVDLTAEGSGHIRSIHTVRENLPLSWQLFGDILILNYPENKYPDFHRILRLDNDRMEWSSIGARGGSKRTFHRKSRP